MRSENSDVPVRFLHAKKTDSLCTGWWLELAKLFFRRSRNPNFPTWLGQFSLTEGPGAVPTPQPNAHLLSHLDGICLFHAIPCSFAHHYKHPPEKKKNSILQLDFDAFQRCTPSSTNLILSPISPSTTHGCEKLVEHQQEILRSFVPSFSYPHLYAWAMYPTLGFLFLESFWTIQFSSTFPTTHFMELPASNQPSESVWNAETWIHTQESPEIKVKISTSNVAGDFFFGTPIASAEHTKHPPFSESFSIRACRPFPTESTKSTPPIGCSSDPTHSSLSSKVVTFLSFQSGLYVNIQYKSSQFFHPAVFCFVLMKKTAKCESIHAIDYRFPENLSCSDSWTAAETQTPSGRWVPSRWL